MEHPNVGIVRRLYEERECGDLEAVRALLARDVAWHEPELGTEHTGDLHGADAVIAMVEEAQRLTGWTFRLWLHDVVANDRHAVALVNWSSTRDGETLEGREVAVFHIREGLVEEVWFHPGDVSRDREFWR